MENGRRRIVDDIPPTPRKFAALPGEKGEATAYRLLLLLSSHFYSPSSSLNSFPFHTDISMPLPSSSSSSFPRPYFQKRQREKKERRSSESRGRLRRRTRAHFQDSPPLPFSRFPTQTPEEKGRREGENVRRRTAGCKRGGETGDVGL